MSENKTTFSGPRPMDTARMMPGEKAKDFRGTRKLLAYMGKFKFALLGVLLFAMGCTIFNIVGPQDSRHRHQRSCSTASALNRSPAPAASTSPASAQILLLLLGLYLLSTLFLLCPGLADDRHLAKMAYRMRRDISEKNQPHAHEVL